jgi:two-component system, response regulator PdtaR
MPCSEPFTKSIPPATTYREDASCPVARGSANGSGRVVVVLVEDDLLLRMTAFDMLEDAGFEVIEAEHAVKALAILQSRSNGVHALFTDIHMPGAMDGLALAHHTRQNWPWIAILLASSTAIPLPTESPKGSRFLSKPYKSDHVVRHLREMVDDSRPI